MRGLFDRAAAFTSRPRGARERAKPFGIANGRSQIANLKSSEI